MNVQKIYHGTRMLNRIYHSGKIVFLCDPIEFHVIEDGRLIILGALTANSTLDGLYLDCEPDVSELDWTYPVLEGKVLKLYQVYDAVLNGNVLGVE